MPHRVLLPLSGAVEDMSVPAVGRTAVDGGCGGAGGCAAWGGSGTGCTTRCTCAAGSSRSRCRPGEPRAGGRIGCETASTPKASSSTSASATSRSGSATCTRATCGSGTATHCRDTIWPAYAYTHGDGGDSLDVDRTTCQCRLNIVKRRDEPQG